MVKIRLLVCLLFVAHSTFLQATCVTSGKEATGTGTVNYTVGQLIFNTSLGFKGTLNQGIQQNFELFTLSNKKFTALILTAAAYPNPTANYVLLGLRNSNLIGLTYTLYNYKGQLVTNGEVKQKTTRITMQYLPAGVYILKVNQNNQALKTFKIIKK